MAFTDWLFPLLTLIAMEIVLGIDNIVFLAITVARLPKSQQAPARVIGLALALGLRLLLLFSIKFIMGLTYPVFHLSDYGIPAGLLPGEEVDALSWKDLILLAGGLFLIGKSTFEIHDKLEGPEETPTVSSGGKFSLILIQIVVLDLVFSLDSVITAVGMANELWIMVVAMVVAMAVMLFTAGSIGEFVHRHPTIKILALSFLILIGVMLLAEGLGQHINRGYIYFAMGFSFLVELLNLRVRGHGKAVELKEPRDPPL